MFPFSITVGPNEQQIRPSGVVLQVALNIFEILGGYKTHKSSRILRSREPGTY
jgi:hypothetical protein